MVEAKPIAVPKHFLSEFVRLSVFFRAIEAQNLVVSDAVLCEFLRNLSGPPFRELVFFIFSGIFRIELFDEVLDFEAEVHVLVHQALAFVCSAQLLQVIQYLDDLARSLVHGCGEGQEAELDLVDVRAHRSHDIICFLL